VGPKGDWIRRRSCSALCICILVACAVWGRQGRLLAQQVTELPRADRALTAGLEDVFTVGTFDGADWETFGDIQGIAFDRAGNLYIFDAQSSRVVVVDRNGKFVRQVGKKGDGPGELRAPISFAVLRDGTIVIADLGHRAYVLYGPDGAYERMVTFAGRSGDVVSVGAIQADGNGTGILTTGGAGMVRMSGGSDGAQPAVRPIERVDLSKENAVSDTLVRAWKPAPDDKPKELSGGGMHFQVGAGAPRTFEPGLYVGAIPDGGIAYADSSTYAVKIADANGTLQRVIRRPFTPEPVTEKMQQAEKKRRLGELESGQGGHMTVVMRSSAGARPQQLDPATVKEMQKGLIDQMRFYPELPVIMSLATGWGGKVWVVRRGSRPTDVGPVDVLTPAGRYVGTFASGALPFAEDLGKHRAYVAFGPDGLVAHVEKGDLDVPTVVVQRLPAVLR
jgi:hypothetical protein